MKTITFDPPIKTTTKGGYPAAIYSIDPNDRGDGIGGRIETPGMGDSTHEWDDCGICRNATDSCNLDISKPEVAGVIAKLNAARNL